MENDRGRAVVQQESVLYIALTWTNCGSWDEANHVGYVTSAVWETGVNLWKRIPVSYTHLRAHETA